jgi:serine/threonine protein kinase
MRADAPACLTDDDNRLADGVRQLDLFFPFDSKEENSFQVLWEDGGHRVFCRGWRLRADGDRLAVLAVVPAVEHPSPEILDRLAHEYGLKDELDRAWAVRPLELVRERGRTMLVLEDPGGEPLEGLLGQPMAVGPFLHLALGLVAAIARLHQRGLIHKDIKPAHLLVDRASGAVHQTGFGIASRGLVDLGNRLRLLHPCHGLRPSHQHGCLGGLDRAPGGDGQRDSGHALIVRHVGDEGEIVVTEAVPGADKFATDRLTRRMADGFNAILRVLKLGGQRFCGVGRLIHVEWHVQSPLLSCTAVSGKPPGAGWVAPFL